MTDNIFTSTDELIRKFKDNMQFHPEAYDYESSKKLEGRLAVFEAWLILEYPRYTTGRYIKLKNIIAKIKEALK